MIARRISEAKGFQRATADAALRTLTEQTGPRRFLIADEVGLGKTVVARTIVQEMMRSRRRPLVVFYVASNLNIAHQNRAKLLELLPSEAEQKAASATADRLTLAGNSRNRPTHDKLHLYTLTPDTSVPMYRRRGGFGRMEERALIFRLLRGRFPSLDTNWFSDRCRGNQAGEGNWKAAVANQEGVMGVRDLQDRFLEALCNNANLNLINVDAAAILSAAERNKPSQFMGTLRTALALAVMRDIQPDLVIFDEFQKFREMLIDPPGRTPDPVTLSLRGQGGDRQGVLLLSATPYRLYSTRQEEAAGMSHHNDFFELLRFLFGPNSSQPTEIERDFHEFGKMMLAKETPDFKVLGEHRSRIQSRLRKVMSRTERPIGDIGSDSPIHPGAELKPDDLRLFRNWVARLQNGQKRGHKKPALVSFAVPYWLSVPLPIQMLGRDYVAWRNADKKRKRRDEPTFRKTQRNNLEAPKLWPHPQFRALTELAPPSRLALPWVAPSLPWWPLQGPWAMPGANAGKMLIFSRFKAVPPALASLLSFNVESNFGARLRHNYKRTGEAQPLQFKGNRPALPALFFPAPTLIAFTDPRRDLPTNLAQLRSSMQKQVRRLLKNELGLEVRKHGGRRPLWKLLAAIESLREVRMPNTDLPSWEDMKRAWRAVASAQVNSMDTVLEQWDVAASDGLDAVTQSEVASLAEFALSGPGVVFGRALYRFDPTCLDPSNYGQVLDASWNGIRSYLNRALFHVLLTRRGQRYTQAIPEAVVAGNLESVLDEHLWIASRLDADAIARFPRDLLKTLSLYEGRHGVFEPGSETPFVLRCHTAMPFADAKVEKPSGGEDRLRTDDMRRAFNTPFWPNVLTTTSLGQEGLDFHVWCRQLLHWDLCSSPLDLEQREGRIQRFGGLSVRRALASNFGPSVLRTSNAASPWEDLATNADQNFSADESGRTPWWSCPGEKIDRLFVNLPQSRQNIKFGELSRLRWLYRLALGQPHQQDFIETVINMPEDGRQDYTLWLSAWPQSRGAAGG